MDRIVTGNESTFIYPYPKLLITKQLNQKLITYFLIILPSHLLVYLLLNPHSTDPIFCKD